MFGPPVRSTSPAVRTPRSPVRSAASPVKSTQQFPHVHHVDGYPMTSRSRREERTPWNGGRRGSYSARGPVYDPWHDDMVSVKTDRVQNVRYIHTTNSPTKLTDVKSLPNIYNNYKPSSVTRRPQIITTTTTTTTEAETQTLPISHSSYYKELVAREQQSNRNNSNNVDNRQLEAFVTKHGPAVYRCGSKGAPWRHLKTMYGVSGENIMFVDGEVKLCDSRFFPLPSARRNDFDFDAVRIIY